jgi:exosortase A-associated hydrolase 1
MTTERALVFECEGRALPGVLHSPSTPPSRGVVIVVGGPQYRVGSHRQFVLLARHLCERGYAVLRFDYRGMGDADGPPSDFRLTAPDICAAVDALAAEVPSVRSFALWGLCDAASGILMYVPADARIAGVALANPWVRSEAGIARAYLQHYYLERLVSADWWRGLFTGRVRVGASLADLLRKIRTAFARGAAPRDTGTGARSAEPAFQDAMLRGLERFEGRVLLIVSGNDLTAAEFLDLVRTSRRWRRALARHNVVRTDLPAADHTFSRREWRGRVASATAEWLATW